MKILLVNKYHYYRAGPETVYLKTAELLKNYGHDVVFFSMHHPENLPCETKEYFVPFVDLTAHHSLFDKIKIAGRILYSFKAKRNLSRLLDRYQIDVAHLHDICYHISPSILHALKKRRIPIIMTLHDLKMVCTAYYMFVDGEICEDCCAGRYYNAVIKRCVKGSLLKSAIAMSEMYLHHAILDIYNIVDIFITPSAFLKKKLSDMGFEKKVVHLPNFFDIEWVKTAYKESKDVKMNNSFAYVGRLSPEKGLHTILDAAKFLQLKGKDVYIKIIGEGPLREELNKRIRSEHIANVNFLGHLKHEELYCEVKRSLAVILPSECYENCPLSVIEAFAIGKPVIGSRLGGIPELVKDNERGITFEPRNPKDLCSRMEFFMNNPDMVEMMGNKAKDFVIKKLNPQEYYNGLVEIYQKAIKNSN